MATGFGRDEEQPQFRLGDFADLADALETVFRAMPVQGLTQGDGTGVVGAQPIVDASECFLRMRIQRTFTIHLGESQTEDLAVEFNDFRSGSAFEVMHDKSFRDHL